MIKSEQNKRNPLRILEQSARGEIGKGNIGVIAAQKGVGKTACLVHIATDELFDKKHVIHVSFSADINHIISWYEDIFGEIAKKLKLESAKEIHDDIIKNRIILNFNQDGTKINQIASTVKSLIKDGNFSADTIVIDGYDFTKGTVDDIKALHELADEMGLEIWISASLKDNVEFDKDGIPSILKNFMNEIAIIVYMKPENDYIRLQLIKDHNTAPVPDLHLKLDPKSLLIVESK